MGQVETKVFEHQAPPWDAEEVCKKTDLTKDDIKYAPNLNHAIQIKQVRLRFSKCLPQ